MASPGLPFGLQCPFPSQLAHLMQSHLRSHKLVHASKPSPTLRLSLDLWTVCHCVNFPVPTQLRTAGEGASHHKPSGKREFERTVHSTTTLILKVVRSIRTVGEQRERKQAALRPLQPRSGGDKSAEFSGGPSRPLLRVQGEPLPKSDWALTGRICVR